ncbi:MAG: hypothetical protein ACREXS_17275 [Gammaproteobacteria bacterium]
MSGYAVAQLLWVRLVDPTAGADLEIILAARQGDSASRKRMTERVAAPRVMASMSVDCANKTR